MEKIKKEIKAQTLGWKTRKERYGPSGGNDKRKYLTEEHKKNIGKGNKGKGGYRNKDKTYKEMYGPERANEIRRKIGSANKMRLKGKSYEEIYGVDEAKEKKRQHRILTLRRLKEYLGYSPGPWVGKYEKEILDGIETKIGYKLIRQFKVKNLGYFVDGYCKETNTVYEVDESHHFDVFGKLKEKDIERQNQIVEKINCNFIRIVEKEE